MGRRQVLAGFAGAVSGLILIGCGNDRDVPAPTTTGSVGLSLGARFADGFVAPTVLVAGTEQRAPYVLVGGDGWPIIDQAPDGLDLVVRRAGGTEVVFSARVARHGEPGVTPYYPLVFTPPVVGVYDVDGPDLTGSHRLRVADPESLTLVQVGDQMRPVDTPTIDNDQGINPICTQFGGICPLHRLTLTEALARPGPTALLVSTPQFCQTDVCGPALDVLVDQTTRLGSQWSVVHAEVYVNPLSADFALTPVVTTYGLSFEPSLMVANHSGIVTGVVHFTMDNSEVTRALRSAT